MWPSQRCLNSCLLINLTLNFSNGDINVYDEGAVTPTELPNIWLLFRTPTCCYRNIHLPRLLITCTLNSPLLISACSMWAKPISEEHTRACPFLTSTTHFQVLTFCEINERWRQVYFKYLLITWSPGIGEAVKCLHSWSLNIPISILHLYELVVLSCCYSSIHKTCFFKRYSSEIEFLFFL